MPFATVGELGRYRKGVVKSFQRPISPVMNIATMIGRAIGI